MEYYDIEHEPFFTISSPSGYKYYQVAIKDAEAEKLQKIMDACEAVEKACWHAQEEFRKYFKERDLLSYIVKDGKLIGFQLLSCWISEPYVAFGFDETMVLKEYSRANLGLALCTIAARALYLFFCKKKGARFTFLSISPNPGVILGYYNYRFLFSIMDNPFRLSADLMAFHDRFLSRNKLSLVHKDYPFVIKNMFPGSLNPFVTEPFPEKLKRMIPDDANFFDRGDAFAFIGLFSKYTCWPPITFMMFRFFGMKYITNPNVGILKKKVRITFREG